jgi:hypothetical protein
LLDSYDETFDSEAEAFIAPAKLADEYEIESGFCPLADVLAMGLPEQCFLEAALQVRRSA